MHTYPYPRHAAVARNNFRQSRYQPAPIPPFNDARGRLPQPILPDHPAWLEMYWRGWELVWQHLRRPRPQSGFIANYIDAGANGHIYLPDAVFMSQFGVYGRRAFNFQGTLDNFYARQHDDGFICREINADDGLDYFHPFDPNGAGPNICAWGEWRHYRQSGDRERIAAVFWPLLGLHDWYHRHRTWPSGLYWSTGLAGGLNNQARVPDGFTHHRHWTWLDANLQSALNCAVLGKMAALLDESAVADGLAEEQAFLEREINARLWDDDAGFYKDLSRSGRFSDVLSVVAFWAFLVPGVLDDSRRAALVGHLRDEGSFWRPHPVPAQSARGEAYDGEGGDHWNSGVWPPANYIVLRGLRAIGQHHLAHRLARRHLEQVGRVFERTNTFWQYYAPEGAREGAGARPDFTGWSALTPIAILLEDIIGVAVDWPRRRVRWDRRLEGRYGVANLPVGPKAMLTIAGDEQRIQVTTTVPLTLVIQGETGTTQTAVPAGESEISLS